MQSSTSDDACGWVGSAQWAVAVPCQPVCHLSRYGPPLPSKQLLSASEMLAGQPLGSDTKQGTEGTTAASSLKPRNDLCKQLKASGCA